MSEQKRWHLSWSLVTEVQGFFSYTAGNILIDHAVEHNSKCSHLPWAGIRRCYWTEQEHRWPVWQNYAHFFSVRGLTVGKARKTQQDTQVHSPKYTASLFLPFTFSMDQILQPQQLATFPVIEQRVRDNVVGDLFSLSLLHRNLCAREVTSESFVKTKIFSGSKLAFRG